MVDSTVACSCIHVGRAGICVILKLPGPEINLPFMFTSSSSVCFSKELRLSTKTLSRLKLQQQFGEENFTTFNRLTAREREVLTLICEGHNNEEVAGLMDRSVNTVRTHRNNIWRTLNIRSVIDAVRWAEAFDLI